jgi:hypothetical protein
MTGTLTEQEKLWALYIQLLVSRSACFSYLSRWREARPQPSSCMRLFCRCMFGLRS